MPIIFAQALMFVPALIGQFRPEWLQSGGLLTKFNNPNSFPYNLVYFFNDSFCLHMFYTALVIKPCTDGRRYEEE
jgi:preprotein translocase subunit SecY